VVGAADHAAPGSDLRVASVHQQLSSDFADATVVHQIRTRHVGTLVRRQEEGRAAPQ
jgi:hypothetical protein